MKNSLGYANWLFRKKGTAAEPFPTAEQLWDDPEVQEIIKYHNHAVEKHIESIERMTGRNFIEEGP